MESETVFAKPCESEFEMASDSESLCLFVTVCELVSAMPFETGSDSEFQVSI